MSRPALPAALLAALFPLALLVACDRRDTTEGTGAAVVNDPDSTAAQPPGTPDAAAQAPHQP
ncbi:MAG TPA: hypothetical protein VFF91_03005, partial [Pseudoxanthomonas sp.]|nr:hypothetical protein [Pseudoxanthomonas sp.]